MKDLLIRFITENGPSIHDRKCSSRDNIFFYFQNCVLRILKLEGSLIANYFLVKISSVKAVCVSIISSKDIPAYLHCFISFIIVILHISTIYFYFIIIISHIYTVLSSLSHLSTLFYHCFIISLIYSFIIVSLLLFHIH